MSWDAFLDDVETALAHLEDGLAAGRAPAWPVLEPPPGTDCSAAELDRSGALLARMSVAAGAVEALQSSVRAQLDALPRPQARTVGYDAGQLGSALDILG